MNVKEIVKVTEKTLKESFKKVGKEVYQNKKGVLYRKIKEGKGVCQLERL